MKRAIGWKKSQRKAVNKRKKENIQNSKLFAKWEPENEDTEQSEVLIISLTPESYICINYV